MDQFALIHFVVKRGDRTYFFLAQPGSPFEEAQEVCGEFEREFVRMKEEFELAEKERSLKGAEQAEPLPVEVKVVP